MTRAQPVSRAMLDYAAPASQQSSRRPLAQFVRLALALPALVVPFVHFTYGTSPLEAVSSFPVGSHVGDWMVFLLGLSFFAGMPIVAWQVVRLAWPAPPAAWARTALFILACLLTVPATGVVALMVNEIADEFRTATEPSVSGDELLMLAVGVVPLLTGIALCAWRWRRRMPLAAAESLLVTGYLANAAICFLGFHDDPQLGYWLATAPTASFALALLQPQAPSE